jgi:membrane protein implicated in regulation of membrane protease activity
MKRLLLLIWGLVPMLAASPALAYVGPGAGLSLLGALWGLLLAVLAALSFIILWPLKRYRRRQRARQEATAETPRQESGAHDESR